MRKFIIVLSFSFFVFMIIGISIVIYFKTRKPPVIDINEVNLLSYNDGIYTGNYETNLVKATVKVKVKNHRIVEITIIKHENGLGSKAEKIVDDIILKQSLHVDDVSGATWSSNVIKKAIEQALMNPINVE